ncbi:hypothetical protein D0T51_07650 [Parabacteroides sp. 52]|uniref:Mfa1 family fimbria major subunit n=1 Tax=unclassified Parabacteroides TaxID=2649774 RepID=UPI0013D324DB|nr:MULTISPECIES: Mfa1 family fimbria major subunit [unclassified Parabacteroides]MDH6534884.1 hypothetical protein [Parabacteroides sp. PM5-20]NDV55601.1 hypothetical protein [Parabacteroides sp. 52]
MNLWIKTIMFGWICCLGIVFSSCSDTFSTDDEEKPEESAKEGMAYFSFSLTTDWDFLSTKAYAEEGFGFERRVNKIYLCFYEAGVPDHMAQLIFRVELNASTDGSSAFAGSDVLTNIAGESYIPSTNNFISKPMIIARQEYQLVVLANPTAAILNRAKPQYTVTDTEGKKPAPNPSVLKDLLDEVTHTTAAHYMDNIVGFFMSNANGVRPVRLSHLRSNPEEAAKFPIAVNLDRIVAKVRVNEKITGASQPQGYTVTKVAWTLEATNKKTYLLRNFGLLAPAFNVMETVANSPYQNRLNQYAVDPNFEGHTVDGYDWDSNYLILNTGPAGGYHSAPFMEWNDKTNTRKTNAIYALENTTELTEMTTPAEMRKYVTGVVVKANIQIATPPINGGNYYSCVLDNTVKVFTHMQAKKWKTNPATIPAEMEGIAAVFAAAEAAPGSPFDFSSDTEPISFVYSTVTEAKNLTFHYKGLNIYPPIYIKHFGYSSGTNPLYGYYGLVRNNIYDITVNSFLGPASPVSDQHLLSVDIKINPWYIREGQGEDLM